MINGPGREEDSVCVKRVGLLSTDFIADLPALGSEGADDSPARGEDGWGGGLGGQNVLRKGLWEEQLLSR